MNLVLALSNLFSVHHTMMNERKADHKMFHLGTRMNVEVIITENHLYSILSMILLYRRIVTL